MKRRHLTDEQIRKLPRKTKRYILADPELIGHYLRVPPRKSKAPITFVVVRRVDGRQKWTTLGTTETLTLAQARARAKRGQGGATVAEVARNWLMRRVRASGFRTARERERIVEKYIIPPLGSRAMSEVRRDDITAMLDRIEGASMADSVLAIFGAIARWHQTRHEDYHPPLTKRMWRVTDRRRKRILTDDEIKAIWNCSGGGSFGVMAKLALLTAQRRDKLRTLRWDDLDNDIWTIRAEPREKGNPGELKLPKPALDIIKAQPRINAFVFPGRGETPIGDSGHYKAELDRACGVRDWRFHDLRRTARSLMARAGVQTEIAERVLGHARGELIEIYDRHHYQDEMASALEKLAALIEQIVAF
jgi:integrase